MGSSGSSGSNSSTLDPPCPNSKHSRHLSLHLHTVGAGTHLETLSCWLLTRVPVSNLASSSSLELEPQRLDQKLSNTFRFWLQPPAFVHPSIHPSTHPSVLSILHPFIHSFTHSFIRSFVFHLVDPPRDANTEPAKGI